MKAMHRHPFIACWIFAFLAAVSAQEPVIDQSQRPCGKKAEGKELLKSLVGSWEGMCRTWFEPGKLGDESKIMARIRPIFDSLLFRLEYESTIQGRPRKGGETMAFNSVTKKFQSAWIDDFHMNYAIMFSEGEASASGFFVTGKYDVSLKNPPWGWKTVFEVIDEDHLTITAYNITPSGQEAKAVEKKYYRVKQRPINLKQKDKKWKKQTWQFYYHS